MTRRLFALSLFSLGALVPAWAEGKSLLNLDKQGVALQGFDPVAFFTLKAPVKGRAEFTREYQGAKYRFHSAKSQAAFDADPEKYAPRFGGYCAYGVSRGRLVPIDPEAFQIVDGRLLLQYSRGVRDDFNRDPEGNLKKAEEQWPRLVEKQGRRSPGTRPAPAMIEIVRTAVYGLAGYAAAGVLFALMFQARGLERLDPAARGSGVLFRLLITPGLAALWPLVGLKWLQALRGRPFPGDPESPASPRGLRRAHAMAWKVLAFLVPIALAATLWSRPDDHRERLPDAPGPAAAEPSSGTAAP